MTRSQPQKERGGRMRVLSLGGGVQSTALALMAVEGEIAFDVAIFADTGAEPQYVYQHLDFLRSQLVRAGIRYEVVSNGNILEMRASPPLFVRTSTGKGALRRQCTQDYKITPIRRWLRANGATASHPAAVLFGITFDEAHRMRPSDVHYAIHEYPLIDMRMRREDCEKWLRDHGYDVPGKSSCYFCPYHTDYYWKWLLQKHQDEFEKACAVDEAIRRRPGVDGDCYLHKSLKPLRVVGEELKKQPELEFGVDGECGGYCLT